MRDIYQNPWRPYNVREITPEGWIKAQLTVQAEGLGGKLHTFWPDIKDSKWIGGSCEGWERVPYWLDGLIPLAWLLENEELKRVARRYVEAILLRQQPDGWICPCGEEERAGYDVWAVLLVTKTLTVYADADGDESGRVREAVRRALKQLNRHLDIYPLFGWAQMRWYEGLIPLYWLAERQREPWQDELIVKLKCQGFDYAAFYRHWIYRKAVPQGEWGQLSHIVNNVMMLKGDALYSRFSHSRADRNKARAMLGKLTRYHGTVTGAITGDECLSGLSPSQGSELCSIAELMYSLEQLAFVTGEADWYDRLESLAFNCLPAAFTPDMWAHQYDQQVNQVQCVQTAEPVFNTNGGDANLFGLEPHFGCCTANFGQAWPKFVQSAVVKSRGGAAVLSYLPLTVQADGFRLRIETDYPFTERVEITVDCDRPEGMELALRIPGWAEDFSVNGEKARGSMAAVRLAQGSARLTVEMKAEPKLVVRPAGMRAVKMGPLVYSLKIAERFVRVHEDVPGREAPHCDYEVYPVSDWNYALVPGPIEVERRPFTGSPFSPEKAPVVLKAGCRKVVWPLERGSAAPRPESAGPIGETEQKEFIPYGCTNIRLTEMPLAAEETAR